MYKKTDLVIFAEITEFIIAMEKVVRTKIKDLLKMQPGQEVLAKGWVYPTREEAESALPKVAAEMGVKFI